MTKPRSSFALDALRRISKAPVPTQEFNPGVVHKLVRENAARIESLPSPYATHKGANIEHLVLVLPPDYHVDGETD